MVSNEAYTVPLVEWVNSEEKRTEKSSENQSTHSKVMCGCGHMLKKITQTNCITSFVVSWLKTTANVQKQKKKKNDLDIKFSLQFKSLLIEIV